LFNQFVKNSFITLSLSLYSNKPKYKAICKSLLTYKLWMFIEFINDITMGIPLIYSSSLHNQYANNHSHNK
jgi:hypothetical protein